MSQPQGHSAGGKMTLMKYSKDAIGNRLVLLYRSKRKADLITYKPTHFEPVLGVDAGPSGRAV